MTKEEALAICRYYKGEEKYPSNMGVQIASYWLAESSFAIYWEGKDIYMEEIENKLVDYRNDDGVPLRLKAFLYLSIFKHCKSYTDTDDEFDNFFKNDAYLRYYYRLPLDYDINDLSK